MSRVSFALLGLMVGFIDFGVFGAVVYDPIFRQDNDPTSGGVHNLYFTINCAKSGALIGLMAGIWMPPFMARNNLNELPGRREKLLRMLFQFVFATSGLIVGFILAALIGGAVYTKLHPFDADPGPTDALPSLFCAVESGIVGALVGLVVVFWIRAFLARRKARQQANQISDTAANDDVKV